MEEPSPSETNEGRDAGQWAIGKDGTVDIEVESLKLFALDSSSTSRHGWYLIPSRPIGNKPVPAALDNIATVAFSVAPAAWCDLRGVPVVERGASSRRREHFCGICCGCFRKPDRS
ncbi:MAG: hypothetical protein R2881_10860 [Eubacteriales bacterium]